MESLKFPIIFATIFLLVAPLQLASKIRVENKRDRWKHIRFVIASVSFALLSSSFFVLIKGYADAFFQWETVKSLFVNFLPEGSYDYVVVVLVAIIFNVVILNTFVIIKFLTKFRLDKLQAPSDWKSVEEESNRKWVWILQNWVYSFDDYTYNLRIPLVSVKHTIRYMTGILSAFYILGIIFLEFMIFFPVDWVSYEAMYNFMKAVYLWPSITMIILYEILYYLSGNEAVESEKIAEDMFSNRLNGDFKHKKNLNKNQPNDMMSENPIINSIARKISEAGGQVDYNFIQHLSQIINKDNMVIDVTIDSEFGEYLYRYLNVVLSKGEKVLFICPDIQHAQKLCIYTEERLRFINGFSPVWKTKVINETKFSGQFDVDLLFVTPQFACDDKYFNLSFFDNLSLVIVSNATEIVVRSNAILSLLNLKLKSKTKSAGYLGPSLQYVFFSESNPLGLRRAIVESLHIDNLSLRFSTNLPKRLQSLSKADMLHDYILATSSDCQTGKEDNINMFLPSVLENTKLAFLHLLYVLNKNGLREHEILAEVNKLEQTVDQPILEVEVALKICYERATHEKLTGQQNLYHLFTFEKIPWFDSINGTFEEDSYTVRFVDNNFVNQLQVIHKPAILKFLLQEDLAPFPANGILQRHLPMQYFAWKGRSYLIQDVKNGVVFLSETNRENIEIPKYSQIRKYLVNNSTLGNESPNVELKMHTLSFEGITSPLCNSLSITKSNLSVNVQTLGFFEWNPTEGPPEFSDKQRVKIIGENNAFWQEKLLREYDAATVLRIKLCTNLEADTDKVAFLLSVMMNEFFKAWFPFSHSCIAVCPVLKNPEVLFEDPYGALISKLYPKMELTIAPSQEGKDIELFIIEDSEIDLGTLRSLFDSYNEMFDIIFKNLNSYLDWQQTFIKNDDAAVSNRYLYFGCDHEPDCFDFASLRNLLNGICNTSHTRSNEIEVSSDISDM